MSEIVLKHSHFDHTGGLAEAIEQVADVPIRAGADDAGTIHDENGVAVALLQEGDPVGSDPGSLSLGAAPVHG